MNIFKNLLLTQRKNNLLEPYIIENIAHQRFPYFDQNWWIFVIFSDKTHKWNKPKLGRPLFYLPRLKPLFALFRFFCWRTPHKKKRHKFEWQSEWQSECMTIWMSTCVLLKKSMKMTRYWISFYKQNTSARAIKVGTNVHIFITLSRKEFNDFVNDCSLFQLKWFTREIIGR